MSVSDHRDISIISTGINTSGSWSDVSDSGHHIGTAASGPQPPTNSGRQVGGASGSTFYTETCEQQHRAAQERDVADRLSQSLDLGHGSLECANKDFDSLPSDSWDGDPTRSHSLPTRRHLLVNGDASAGSGGSGSEMDEPDQSEKIKNKLISAWNNVRHGFTVRMRTSFKNDKPIWLLGRCYFPTPEERAELKRQSAVGRSVLTTVDKFKFDFTSRIWFTYRQDFPCLQGTQITSDVGWGCMLRSGQMLLAHALQLHFLGRDWRWQQSQRQHQVMYHRLIVRMFGDQPDEECPFSIHRLVAIGQEMGKKPGDWYGPNSVAHVLREAMERSPECNPILGQICLYVAQDCTVYKQDVVDLCTQTWPNSRRGSLRSNVSDCSVDITTPSPIEPSWRALVLLIPVRLGGEGLNPIYIPCIQSMLADPTCIGFIGGKPKHSVYFVGWQDEKLIYLDPHFCQDTISWRSSDREYPVETYHCMSPRKMSFTKMDPSCTVGFYCKTKEDFDSFIQRTSEMAFPPKEKGQYPMFVFSRGRMCDASLQDNTQGPDRLLRVRHTDKKGRLKQKDSEDFVFL